MRGVSPLQLSCNEILSVRIAPVWPGKVAQPSPSSALPFVVGKPSNAALVRDDGITTDDTRALARVFAGSAHTTAWRSWHLKLGG
jgi:hypothetical protein